MEYSVHDDRRMLYAVISYSGRHARQDIRLAPAHALAQEDLCARAYNH